MKEDTDINQENVNRSFMTKGATEPPQENEIKNEVRTIKTELGTYQQYSWLEQNTIDELRSRWNSIQAQFVDQPCTAIEQADALVTDAVVRIQQLIANHQSTLRDRWYNHEDASTEDLRVTLQNYRSFLNSLLDH